MSMDMNMEHAIGQIKTYINTFILECQNEHISALCEHLQYGKMLRSKLLLAISGVSEEALRVCALIEMIQNASLLHDDVIDNASTRRGDLSINARFGNKNAIMLGDVLYSKAFYELSKLDMNIAQSVSLAVTRLSIGEIEDVRLSNGFHTNREAYINMCSLKTAALIVAAAESGAILKGLDKDIYSTYGENLGIAFQIIDDILDITQDSSILGKPSMSDFREGKTTLPYMDLYECLQKDKQEMLLSYYAKNLSPKEEEWIKTQMQDNDIIAKSLQCAKNFADKALQAIASQDNQTLRDMITQMLDRRS